MPRRALGSRRVATIARTREAATPGSLSSIWAQPIDSPRESVLSTSAQPTDSADPKHGHKPSQRTFSSWAAQRPALSSFGWSLKLGADSGRVMDDSGTVKRCFPLEFRRKLSSLPWRPAPHSDN